MADTALGPVNLSSKQALNRETTFNSSHETTSVSCPRKKILTTFFIPSNKGRMDIRPVPINWVGEAHTFPLPISSHFHLLTQQKRINSARNVGKVEAFADTEERDCDSRCYYNVQKAGNLSA
jgi:hypothetical protein